MTERKVSSSEETRLDVIKIGGTSIRRLRQSSRAIRYITPEKNPLVVVSARGGVTKQLREVCRFVEEGEEASNKKALRLLDKIHVQHLSAARRSGVIEASIGVFDGSQMRDVTLVDELDRLHEEARDIIVGAESLLPQQVAVILTGGERRSSRLTTARLGKDGVDYAVSVDAEHFLVTDENYLEANIIWEDATIKGKETLGPLVDEGVLPVMTGFTGVTQTGDISCLGPGSSDLAATALARIMRARKVFILTDVGGVYTSDPKKNSDAILIEDMTVRQAHKMANNGHKVLHPRSMEPLLDNNIVVYVRHIAHPRSKGTRISG